MSTTIMEVLLQSVSAGMLLVLAVSIVLRIAGPFNGSTRALVWLATMIALPLVPFFHWSDQTIPAPETRAVVGQLPHAAAPTPAPTAPVVRPVELTVRRDTPNVLLVLYISIASLLLLRLFASYLRIRLLRRNSRPAPPDVQVRLRHWLVRCSTDRNVELAFSDKLRSPVAIGFLHPMILIPSALVLDLSEEEFDDVGVHELAHIRRYDDWTNLLQQFLQAVLFFHPAVYWAGRNLKFECEVACDEWVVSGRASKPYAQCLAKVIELRRWQKVALLSSGAFFSKDQILKRVELLLDKTRNTATGISGFTITAVILIAAGVTLQVAKMPAVVSFSRDNGDSQVTVRWKDGERDLRVKLRGEMTFSDDERSIATISPWGYVEIEDSRGWSTRRLEVRPSSSGAPEQKYFVDGRERPIDQSGREWAASTYPFLMRELGWDAKGRVERILSRAGVRGVLDEVDLIHSGNTKSKYLALLLDQANLSDDDLRRVATSIRKIPSDHEKAELLLVSAPRFASASTRREYFEAVDSIHSDHERKRLLVAALETGGSASGTAQLVAHSAKSISSDNEKATVLQSIPASECREAFFEAVNQIHSDNERARVLRALLNRPGLETGGYENTAVAAMHMASDNEKANVLMQLAEYYSGTAFFDAVNTMHSDNERKRVLMKVIEHSPAKAALVNTIEAASRMPSDNEKAQVLVAAARLSADSEVRSAINAASGSIHSDNEYRHVATALLNAQ